MYIVLTTGGPRMRDRGCSKSSNTYIDDQSFTVPPKAPSYLRGCFSKPYTKFIPSYIVIPNLRRSTKGLPIGPPLLFSDFWCKTENVQERDRLCCDVFHLIFTKARCLTNEEKNNTLNTFIL